MILIWQLKDEVPYESRLCPAKGALFKVGRRATSIPPSSGAPGLKRGERHIPAQNNSVENAELHKSLPDFLLLLFAH